MYDLSPDQEEVLAWVREFARDEIRPHAAHYDEIESTPWPIIERAHEVGLYSLDFVANAALDSTGLLLPLVLEELAYGDAGIALSLFGTTLAATALMANGTPEQQAKWLPRMFEDEGGKPTVAAFCSSEPDAGSDVSSLRTRAVWDEDANHWVLNGQKMWVTNGGLGGVHVVVAVVDPTLGARGHAVFLVPPDHEGLSQGQKILKHGIRASHTAEVVLNNVALTDEFLLGGREKLEARLEKARRGERESKGVNGAMATFEASRPAVGAMAVGIARAALDYSIEYAKTREQFGKPIAATQGVGFNLAEMAARVDSARLLVLRASQMAARQEPFLRAEGSMAKWVAGEAAAHVTHQAMLIHGGNGYTREYPVERLHRDSIIFQTFEGTENIQKAVVARALTGHRVL